MNSSLHQYGSSAMQITCIVSKHDSFELSSLLESLGVVEFEVQSARRTMLKEKRNNRKNSPLLEELVDILRFYVPTENTEQIVSTLSVKFGFGEPGRGSLVVRSVSLAGVDVKLKSCADLGEICVKENSDNSNGYINQDLAALCCIVPRGEAASIARVVLEAGLGAPTVTYGKGVGNRGELGLIRIAIPVEKEIVTLLLSSHDVEEAFHLINVVMKLGSRPGAGFCYWYPIESGILDTRLWVGSQPYVASMEQVIAALDGLTGDTRWRSKKGDNFKASGIPLEMESYTIHGSEGETEGIVKEALRAGAGGATQILLRRERFGEKNRMSSAREVIELIVTEDVLPQIHKAVTDCNLISEDVFVETSNVAAASGYRQQSN